MRFRARLGNQTIDFSDFWYVTSLIYYFKYGIGSFAENLQSPSLVRSLLNTFSAMKQVNEGRRITVGKRDHVGVDTEELLRRIQIAKSAAGDDKFRWLRQNDPAEVLTTLTEGIQNVFPNWKVCPIGVRSYDACGNRLS